ncbi:MAG: AAA family ATPase [Polyangiaceae bacterium]
MKLEKLRLIAYGPFTGVDLDLSSAGIHVIYGKNEAGKSTALRAITGLLYGISRNTPDAHIHRMPDLRVGGTVRASDGTSIEIVRRKGKDNTLLDREGRPIDEQALSRLFGGVTQEQFLGMFGLDHESLRRGGEALLLGGGGVGESLFGATMAGGELHRVLRDLAAEADALFTPKGYTKPLNEALKAFAEAEKRTREQSTSPDAMVQQTLGLAELRRDQEEFETTRQRLSLERTKLERLRRALPLLAKRRAAAERQRSIGEAPLLPTDAGAKRVVLTRVIDEAEREIARLDELLRELTERRSALALPESLVRFDDVPLDLARRLGTFLRALTDLPKLDAEIEEQEEQARAALKRAGRDGTESSAEVRTDATLQATVHRLTVRLAEWREAKTHLQQSLVEQRARRGSLAARRDALPPSRDATNLKKAISRAERDGPLEERLSRLESERARTLEKARIETGALGLANRPLSDVVAMAVPSLETVERFAEEKTALAREARLAAEQKSAVAAEINAARRDIDTLALAGHIPSEEDLLATRGRRDALWQTLRTRVALRPKSRSSEAKAETASLDFAMYEAEVRGADDLADRLRREAERVSRLATLRAHCDASERELAALAAREGEIAEKLAAHLDDWRALFVPLGIEPRPPNEMKSWTTRHANCGRIAEALRDADAQIAELSLAAQRHRQAIGALLDPHRDAPRDPVAKAN